MRQTRSPASPAYQLPSSTRWGATPALLTALLYVAPMVTSTAPVTSVTSNSSKNNRPSGTAQWMPLNTTAAVSPAIHSTTWRCPKTLHIVTMTPTIRIPCCVTTGERHPLPQRQQITPPTPTVASTGTRSHSCRRWQSNHQKLLQSSAHRRVTSRYSTRQVTGCEMLSGTGITAFLCCTSECV